MALKDDVLKFYPQFAWALDNPEVSGVLQNAVNSEWDAGRLVAELQSTQWWKGTEPAVREYQQRLATDPAANDQRLRETEAELWDQSQKLGLNLNADVIRQQAQIGQQFGLSANQLTDSLVQQARAQGYQGVQGNLGGVSTTVSNLKTLANKYMVGADDNTYFQWATNIAAGEKSVDDYQVLFQDWAKAKFSYDPQMVERINNGFTPDELFQPQKTAIAKLLEVNADTVDLTNSKWSQVLDYADPATGTRRAMTSTEAERLTRSTAEWKKTQNGQQAGADLAGRIKEMMTGNR